jgi:hypothetical protein
MGEGARTNGLRWIAGAPWAGILDKPVKSVEYT